jgi:hypothetical protein
MPRASAVSRTALGQAHPTPKSLRGRLVWTGKRRSSRERILAERLAHQRRKPIAALSKIDRFGGHQHAYAGRNRNHDAAITARSTVCNVAASVPGAIRTVAARITITIADDLPGRAAAIDAFPYRRAASTITGANAMPPLPSPSSASRVPRRHPNNCYGVTQGL